MKKKISYLLILVLMIQSFLMQPISVTAANIPEGGSRNRQRG